MTNIKHVYDCRPFSNQPFDPEPECIIQQHIDENAPARNRNIHSAITRIPAQSPGAILSANSAAYPVTFVVNVAKARKPAAFTKPAVIASRDASFTLCR